jgi:hypothetical protein
MIGVIRQDDVIQRGLYHGAQSVNLSLIWGAWGN